MAGANTDQVVSNMLGQISSADPEPISAGVLKEAATIFAIFGAAHAAAMKREAQTLSSAVPKWRSLLLATVDAFNQGQIDASQAVGLIEQAKGIYYQQVGPIERGKPPQGGAPDYYAMRGKRVPGIDPCNGACYVAYWYVEPEAALVEQAFQSGQATDIDLQSITIANTGGQGGVQGQRITVQRSAIASLTSLPGVPAIVKQNPLVFGVLAVVIALVFFGGKK